MKLFILANLILNQIPSIITSVNAQQQQDPTTLNGGSILAMTGKNCVAVAVDKRFGSGPQTVNISPRTVLIPHSRVLVGFTGLEGDVQSLASDLSTIVSEKKGRHLGFGFGDDHHGEKNGQGKEISPKSMCMLLSHVLYGRRSSPFYVEPIVAGLEKRIVNRKIIEGNREQEGNTVDVKTNEMEIEYIPFLCAQDIIGAQSKSSSFVCSGAASKSLYGTAEALWKPELKPEELVQVCGRAFLSGLERDCLSGYGAIIYLLVGGKGIIEIDLACRTD